MEPTLYEQHIAARDRLFSLADTAAKAGNGIKCAEYIRIGNMENEEAEWLINQR